MFRKRNNARSSSTRESIGTSLNSRSNNAAARQSKPRGQFIDRVWHCDCDPPLPAEHFKVKKEGPNKGRWFYTCQKAQEDRCGFFLWDEDAEPRMQAALLNRRDEVADDVRNNTSEAQQRQEDDWHGQFRPSEEPANSKKRKLPWESRDARDDSETEDEALPWPATADDRPVRQTIGSISPPPSTPRKAIKTFATDTPGNRLRPDIGLETPQTATTGGPIKDGSSMTGHDINRAPQPDTPTPARFQDISLTAPITPSKAGSDITHRVLSYLTSCRVKLSGDGTAGLRAILETHNQQVRGFIKGRDVARDAVKMKDGKIADLITKVEALESDLELYRARVKSLKAERDALFSNSIDEDDEL